MKTDNTHGEFAEHQIVSEVEAPGFRSWLLQQRDRRDSGQWSSTFWVRITAAERMLRISGDFDPVVFAYGPNDPEQCVRWMADRQDGDSYAAEKASIGSGGRNRISCWDTTLARQDIQEARDREAEDDPDSPLVSAFDEALDGVTEYSGEYGCHELVRIAAESEEADLLDIAEMIGDAGRRMAPCVWLSLRALRRLVHLRRPLRRQRPADVRARIYEPG